VSSGHVEQSKVGVSLWLPWVMNNAIEKHKKRGQGNSCENPKLDVSVLPRDSKWKTSLMLTKYLYEARPLSMSSAPLSTGKICGCQKQQLDALWNKLDRWI
jgi:hypothetical protein